MASLIRAVLLAAIGLLTLLAGCDEPVALAHAQDAPATRPTSHHVEVRASTQGWLVSGTSMDVSGEEDVKSLISGFRSFVDASRVTEAFSSGARYVLDAPSITVAPTMPRALLDRVIFGAQSCAIFWYAEPDMKPPVDLTVTGVVDRVRIAPYKVSRLIGRHSCDLPGDDITVRVDISKDDAAIVVIGAERVIEQVRRGADERWMIGSRTLESEVAARMRELRADGRKTATVFSSGDEATADLVGTVVRGIKDAGFDVGWRGWKDLTVKGTIVRSTGTDVVLRPSDPPCIGMDMFERMLLPGIDVGDQLDVISGDLYVGTIEVARFADDLAYCKVIGTGWVAEAQTFEAGQLAVLEER